MKISPVSIAFLGLLAPLAGQETPPKWDVEIPIPVIESQPLESPVEAEPTNFTVLNSRIKRVQVIETPEMHDLPPIEGTINLTVQKVANPGLPDPVPPLSALSPEDPAVIEQLEEMRENYQGADLVFVSASVIDRRRTLLRIYPNGQAGDEITAVSNIDFNHFSGGHGTYRVNREDGSFRDIGLLVGLGNSNTHHSETPENAALPEVSDIEHIGPAFVVISGDQGSPAMDTLEQLHDLYRKSGQFLKTAYLTREAARVERKAYLLANPPTPKDVTIKVWKLTPDQIQNLQTGEAQ